MPETIREVAGRFAWGTPNLDDWRAHYHRD